MTSTARRVRLALVIGCLPLVAAGCQLAGLTSSGQPRPKASIIISDPVASSVTIVAGRPDATAAAAIARDTVQPSESLVVLGAGQPVRVVVASVSPAPASLVIPGRPTRPRAGSSPYQWSKYRQNVRSWQKDKAAATQKANVLTDASETRWLDGLTVSRRLDTLPPVASAELRLGRECADAADEMAGLATASGSHARPVLVLYASALGGAVQAGELNGDAVIVVTNYLPSAAAVGAAQIRLVRAGALRATIVGPAAPTSQIASLITEDEQLTINPTALPNSELFPTGSAVLLASAQRELAALVPALSKPGTTAIINGYASTPGSPRQNFRLSYARASAVASFLEARGVPPAALTVIGHGAVGPSLRDQKVTVLIERP